MCIIFYHLFWSHKYFSHFYSKNNLLKVIKGTEHNKMEPQEDNIQGLFTLMFYKIYELALSFYV